MKSAEANATTERAAGRLAAGRAAETMEDAHEEEEEEFRGKAGASLVDTPCLVQH